MDKTMKLLNCLLLLTVVVISKGEKPHYNLKCAPCLFKKFMKDYNRTYKDQADKDAHYKAFVESLKVINDANARSSSATFDINEFADYTPEERNQMFGLRFPDDSDEKAT